MENVVLIGMPGAGKSTVGIVLAKVLGYEFMDTDLVLQKQQKRLLWQIIRDEGTAGFRTIEGEMLGGLTAVHTVISTGGSAVYMEEAMRHLKEVGTVVYLEIDYEALKCRLGDLNKRGVVLEKGQTLRDLYEERTPLYERYADITIPQGDNNISQTVAQIVEALGLEK